MLYSVLAQISGFTWACYGLKSPIRECMFALKPTFPLTHSLRWQREGGGGQASFASLTLPRMGSQLKDQEDLRRDPDPSARITDSEPKIGPGTGLQDRTLSLTTTE